MDGHTITVLTGTPAAAIIDREDRLRQTAWCRVILHDEGDQSIN